MKAIKYLLMGVLLAGFSTTANAQEEELQAALNAIKSKSPEVADLAKTAYKKNKKNPENLMKIARAYFEQKDTAGAIKFANYANEAGKPKYQYAPAYLLLGDIESAYGTDGGKAAGYYNQAINFDPKNPEGYKKWAMVYRKISPSQAAAKLQEMKQQCPNEDIDAFTAHIYMLAGDEKKTLQLFHRPFRGRPPRLRGRYQARTAQPDIQPSGYVLKLRAEEPRGRQELYPQVFQRDRLSHIL